LFHSIADQPIIDADEPTEAYGSGNHVWKRQQLTVKWQQNGENQAQPGVTLEKCEGETKTMCVCVCSRVCVLGCKANQ